MKSFWEESYDGAKDRRYGMLFFATLLVFFGALIIGGVICGVTGASSFQELVLPVLPGVAIVLVVSSWLCIRRLRKIRKERLKYAALSRDELAKARSKLRNNTRPMKRVAPPPTDFDLKY